MRRKLTDGRIRVKALIILLVTVLLVVSGLFAGHRIRKRLLAKRAMARAESALASHDWEDACRYLRRYLSKYPDDVAALCRYGQANLAVYPLDRPHLWAAVGAYRRVIRLDPGNELAYRKLSLLYSEIADFGELAYIAERRLKFSPDDWQAYIWLARGFAGQKRYDEARKVLQLLVDRLKDAPTKRVEYVRACLLLGSIASRTKSQEGIAEALNWLNEASRYDPASAETILERARFYRLNADRIGGDHDSTLAAAQADLEKVERLPITDPRIWLLLSGEWLAHGRLDKAAACLDAAKRFPRGALKEYFADLQRWDVAVFLQETEVLQRRGVTGIDASLADQVLSAIADERKRFLVLPAAARLYIAAGKVGRGRQCISEYKGILKKLPDLQVPAGSLAYLEALQARAEGKPYEVIRIVEPVASSSAAPAVLLKFLGEACSTVGQTGRAVRALSEYLKRRPGDESATALLLRENIRLGRWRQVRALASDLESSDRYSLTARLAKAEAELHLAVGADGSVARPRVESVLAELLALRKEHPRRSAVRVLIAIAEELRGDCDKARSELLDAIKSCDQTLPAELALARLYFRLKRYSEALQVCQRACRRYSDMALPYLALAEMLNARGEYERALQVLKDALAVVSNEPDRRDLQVRLAAVEMLHGQRERGIGLLRTLAGKYKNDVQIRSILLRLPEVRNQPSEAERLLADLKRIEGQAGLQWRLMQAHMWLSQDGWFAKQREIRELLDTCLAADPGWAAPAVLLGEVYERLGDLAAAEAVYRRTLAENRSALAVADRLLNLLIRQKRFADAKRLLSELAAGPSQISRRRVVTAIAAGQVDDAIQGLELTLSSDPSDAESLILLARLTYMRTSDAAAALKYLDKAEALAGLSIPVAAARASILRAEGRIDEAKSALNRLVDARGDFGSYLLRATFLTGLGDLSAAEQDYRRLADLGHGARGYELLSEFYRETGRLNEAVETLRSAVRIFPADPRLRRRLVAVLISRATPSDLSEARRILDDSRSDQPDDPAAMFLDAQLLMRAATPESLDRARRLLEQVVAARPAAVEAHLVLVNLEIYRKDYVSARRFAIRALGINPGDARLMLARAQAELALGNVGMAGELAGLVLDQDSKNRLARDILVRAALAGRGNQLLRAALKAVRNGLSQNPSDAALHIDRARLLAATGQRKQAVAQLKQFAAAVALNGSQEVPVLLTLADLYREAGRLDEAERCIKRAESVAQAEDDVCIARFKLLADQGAFDQILNTAEKYLRSGSASPAAVLAGIQTVVNAGTDIQRSRAAELLAELHAANPDFVPAILALALRAYRQGRVDEAETLYRKVLALEPNNVEALNNLAWILAERRGRYSEALTLADRGIQLSPRNIHLYDTRGTILCNMPGRVSDAVSDFKMCLDLAPQGSKPYAKALLQLGRAYFRLGRYDLAQAHLKRAVGLDASLNVFTETEKAEIQTMMHSARKQADSSGARKVSLTAGADTETR